MLKRIFSAALAMILCLGAMPALAEESVSARVSLADASDAQRLNISLAMNAVDGVLVDYGEQFSFNETVGPRTKSYGFVTARNGRGANVTGGGVAQAASALYLALKALDGAVQIDEIHTYGSRYNGSYVSSASDAVLVDYSAGSDFAFTNYEDDLRISMWMTDAWLYCSLSFSSGQAQPDSFLNWDGSWDTEWNNSSGDDWEEDAWDIEWEEGGWNNARSVISTASIRLRGSDSLINNIALAAASIDDTVLPRDAVFSFNGMVGPRGERYGYETAINGRGAEVVGGGVAQVASVLWLAVKNLDCVSIVEKSTYGKKYNQDYVASSNDAILTDYGEDIDFSFRNTGDHQLTVCTYISDGVLRCEIWEN